MRISDWSSDVCSSDLALPFPFAALVRWGAAGKRAGLFGLTSFGSSVPGAECCPGRDRPRAMARSEEHTSELQSLMRISYAVFCLKKKTKHQHSDKPSTTANIISTHPNITPSS